MEELAAEVVECAEENQKVKALWLGVLGASAVQSAVGSRVYFPAASTASAALAISAVRLSASFLASIRRAPSI